MGGDRRAASAAIATVAAIAAVNQSRVFTRQV